MALPPVTVDSILITLLYSVLLAWGFGVGLRQIWQGYRHPDALLNPLLRNRHALGIFTLHIVVVSADLCVCGPLAIAYKSPLWYWGGRVALLSSSLPVAALLKRNSGSFGKLTRHWVVFRNTFEVFLHIAVAAAAVNWLHYYVLLWWLVAYRYLDVGPRRLLQKIYDTPEKLAARPWAPTLTWLVSTFGYLLTALAIYHHKVIYAVVPDAQLAEHVPRALDIALVVTINVSVALLSWIMTKGYTASLLNPRTRRESAYMQDVDDATLIRRQIDAENCVESQLREHEQIRIGSDTVGVSDIRPPDVLLVKNGEPPHIPVFVALGWLGIPHDYRALIRSLAMEGHRALSVDAPHGVDYKGIFGDVSSEFPRAEVRKAAALVATCDRKGIDRIDVVAHSEGAMYVAIAATLRPDMFRNVVFVAPAGMLQFREEGDSRLLAIVKFAKHYVDHRQRWNKWTHEGPEDRRDGSANAARMSEAERSGVGVARIVRTLARPWRLIAEACAQAHFSIGPLLESVKKHGIKIVVILSAEDTLYTAERLAGSGGGSGEGSTIKKGMVRGVLTIRGGEHGAITPGVIVAVMETLRTLRRTNAEVKSVAPMDVDRSLTSIEVVLREPLVRYYTDTYNGMISVVEGVALAALLVDNKDVLLNGWPRWELACKGITAALVIAQLWHRYVSGNQFLASRPGLMEAVLPMLLAVSQIALGLSIQNTAGRFSFWMLCVACVGALSYQNRICRSTRSGFRDEMKKVLVGTEAGSDDGARRMCGGILEYQRQGRKDALVGCVAFAGCWAVVASGVLKERGEAAEAVFMFAMTSYVYLRLFLHESLPAKLKKALQRP